MTTARTGATTRSLARSRWIGPTFSSSFHRTWVSSRPRAMALVTMAGMSVMRPTMRAASALSRTVSPTGEPSGRPTTPAWRNSARNDSAAATAQTMVCRRPTGMPSRAARSARSAAARTATPTSVNRRNAATAIIASGASTHATRWSASNTSGATSARQVNGAVIEVLSGSSPQMLGTMREANESNWARPIVATVRIRRGWRKKRRTTASSTTAPTTTAAARPSTRAST
jgi:hypothetical protein